MKGFINQIKPLFPITYNPAVMAKLLSTLKIEFKDPKAWLPMALQIVAYVLADIIAGIVLGIVGFILPILGFFWGTIGTLVGIYTLCGIVLSICDYLNVFEPKDQNQDQE